MRKQMKLPAIDINTILSMLPSWIL